MGLISFFRNLFRPTPPTPTPLPDDGKDYRVFKPFSTIDNERVDLKKYFGEETPEDFAFREAGTRGGDYLGFKLHLNRIYSWYYEERRSISHQHNEETSERIEQLEGDNKNIEAKINFITTGNLNTEGTSLGQLSSKEETIPYKEKKIKELKDEILNIQENPKGSKHLEDYDDNKNHRLNFTISLVGMTILIVFLWIFYSSVIYSALWREFKPGRKLFLESILYPKAVEESFSRSTIIGIAVIILPFAFALLAFAFEYLFSHKKYLWGIILLLFAFTLDSFLAYRITERIYQISHTSFSGVAEYSLSIAAKDPNFWIIISLGFAFYLFLGFIYYIFNEALKALNKVKRAIKKRKDMISQLENELQKLKEDVNRHSSAIEDNKRKITSYRKSLLTTIFRFDAFRDITDHFVLGWTKYQEHSRKQDLKKESENFYSKWLRSIEDSLVAVTDIN